VKKNRFLNRVTYTVSIFTFRENIKIEGVAKVFFPHFPHLFVFESEIKMDI